MSIDENAFNKAWDNSTGSSLNAYVVRNIVEAYEAAKAPVIEQELWGKSQISDALYIAEQKEGNARLKALVDETPISHQPDDCRMAFEVWARSKSFDLFGYGINGRYHDGKTDRPSLGSLELFLGLSATRAGSCPAGRVFL